uniref:Uncharacterized protein n=1 Tax=Panagrolaimus sp. JU765 TaxID=591449 RepID=A0AC34RIL0_9BILA
MTTSRKLSPGFLLITIILGVSKAKADSSLDDNINEDKRAGGRGFLTPNLLGAENYDKRTGEIGIIDPESYEKRAGGRGFLNVIADKRGGARGFSVSDDYHSAERRAGGRAFAMPATGDELWSQNKRAGGRPFYGITDFKRAGGRLFHFYDAPMIKRAGGRGFIASDFDKRAGARAFVGPSFFNSFDYYPKRGGSRPFYAATSWRGYPLQK